MYEIWQVCDFRMLMKWSDGTMGLLMGLIMLKHFDTEVRKPYNAGTCYLHFCGPKVEQKTANIIKDVTNVYARFSFDKEKLFHWKFDVFIERIYCFYIKYIAKSTCRQTEKYSLLLACS